MTNIEEGDFIGLVKKFLDDEKIEYKQYHNFGKTTGIEIKRENDEILITERECKTECSAHHKDKIDMSTFTHQKVPITSKPETNIIRFTKYRDKKDINIRTNITAKGGIPGMTIAVAGARLDITIKDVLKEPSKYIEEYNINCRCDHPIGLKCQGIRYQYKT